MSPKISTSLLVPCFNAQNYINDFINNISLQTVPFDEVIFYNDGSTDKTREMLDNQTFGRVIHSSKNQGSSKARNELLKSSYGDLIHFHDIDDFLDPTFLEKTSLALTSEVDAVIVNMKVIDRNTERLLGIYDYSELTNHTDPIEFFLTHCGYAIIGLYRRECLNKIGGFRESLSRDEDPDFHIRLASSGAKIISLPIPLTINRFGTGTYSSMSYVACWREHLKALQFYINELPANYHPILKRDSGRMIALCAACDDLELAYDYLDFYESLGEQGDIPITTSKPLKILASCIGYRNALKLRFGRWGKSLRSLYPWRIG